LRYIITAAVAAILLAVALKARQPVARAAEDPSIEAATRLDVEPEVQAVDLPDGGKQLTVRLRCSGSVSRVRLVYRLNGDRHTAQERTDCKRSLAASGGFEQDGYATEVVLEGRIPQGASRVEVIVESETGTGFVPVELT
jgi:hypothetical protein